jgi:hypothetical protein
MTCQRIWDKSNTTGASCCVVLSTNISVQKRCSLLSFFFRSFMFYHLFVFIYAYSCPTRFLFNTIFVSCNTTGLEIQELSTFPEHPNLPSVNSEWFDLIWFDLLCLTPFSAIFQLYHGDQFYWWNKPEYPERTTDHGKAIGKLYHLRLRVECIFFVIYKAGREPTPYWW